MKTLIHFISFIIIFFFSTSTILAVSKVHITGKVTTTNRDAVDYATVYLKGTKYGSSTDSVGVFHLQAPAGEYTLVVSSMGYKTVEKPILLSATREHRIDVEIVPDETVLKDVVIQNKAIERVKESAYNVVALDAEKYHNSAAELTTVLAKAPGIKIRESGGVGSDMRLMMDGFTGKHIKIFIDGVPQDGVGSSFGLNNIPVNFAERIEVYKGVVPVGFGTDALAGIINIVTNKNKHGWFADASYSYGSFHTHKTYINFGKTFKSGFTYEVNAFQNYSDNNYWIDVPVEEFLGDSYTDGSRLNEQEEHHVQRFHDAYHNESVIGKIGWVNKKWADRLIFNFNYSRSYKEIQNGVDQKIVFGEKHRKGHSIMPSLEYRKRDLFTRGLDVALTANYNKNETSNIDTATYKFNWRGEKQTMAAAGEYVYQDSRSENSNWNGTFTANYRLAQIHTFTFNHVISSFRRTITGTSGSSGASLSNAIARENTKNIGGLSYRLMPSEIWNLSVFGKYYTQSSSGPVATSDSGDNYIRSSRSIHTMGYGIAGTYFILKMLQAKLSYERAYRLPSEDEMFGDEDMEQGLFSLKPENSDNFNLNLNYNQSFGTHAVYLEGGLIFRSAKDYIQRTISTNQIARKNYGSYQNHGRVETKGYNISLHYSFSNWVTVGGSFTQMDVRDKVKTVEQGTAQQSITYGARIENTPYKFANSDVTFYWHNFLEKNNTLTFTYDNLYFHSFPLHSEKTGNRAKKIVPTQFSHNLNVTYSLKNGRYNLSFECRNVANEKLYDNYGLQKAGRAFYGKLRVYLGSF